VADNTKFHPRDYPTFPSIVNHGPLKGRLPTFKLPYRVAFPPERGLKTGIGGERLNTNVDTGGIHRRVDSPDGN